MYSIEDKTAKRIGDAVKNHRERRHLSLRELAARSRVSASMISDVERGLKSPTISTLCLLAEALQISASSLVDEAIPPLRRIQLTPAKKRIATASRHARRENLAYEPFCKNIQFVRYIVAPHTVAGPFPAHPRGTVEHIHLASGALRLVCGDDEARLQAGDSCSCLADAPHLFDNRDGRADALLYLVIERA